MRRAVRLLGVSLAVVGYLALIVTGTLLRDTGEVLCGLADRGYPPIKMMLSECAEEYDISI